MSAYDQNPFVAFVWRVEEITSAVVEMARRTGCRIIFDASGSDLDALGPALLRADAGADVVDLKISPASLMDPNLEEFRQETGIETLWIELHPLLLEQETDVYLNRIEKLSLSFKCFPVIGDVRLINRIADEYPAIEHIALKGCEASGFVSQETSLVLYGIARDIKNRIARPLDLAIWGGVATPQGAAAFLASGTQGIVFESVHWLTDLVAVDDRLREKVTKLRPDHTDLTGLNLEAPCRLFNKGNSQAVKELKDFAGSLCGSEIRDEQRRFFSHKIDSEKVMALNSGFDRKELIPLAAEASFASSFVRRYGSNTEEAVGRFIQEINQLVAAASEKERVFEDSPVAGEMGTRYPFVQGAMSWISDVPAFAASVAEAGGLPTLALGLMDMDTLESKLGNIKEVMGDRPFAVNVVALAENPFRDAQLAWIKEIRPKFAVIAAGEPSHARELIEEDIGVIYIAPNEELLRMAFEAGVRYVICEGNEAGGHIGEHTTLSLAQIVLDLKDREPELFQDRRIILAGGIHDRETAFIAAMLGADAIQMGTAYLATTEIVETQALSEVYRQTVLESEPGGTVVTGEGTGLRVRSLRTPRMEAVCSLERDFAAGSEDEASFRHKIEALSAGSLFIAARGLDKPGGKPLGDPDCIEQGQFMSGACAASLTDVRSVEALHHELAEGKLREGLPVRVQVGKSADVRPEMAEGAPAAPAVIGIGRRAQHASGPERIAVTGMAVANSLGNSPEEVWAASLAMASGVIEVPASKWDHGLYFHPRPRMPEKTYCRVGAFQNVEVSRKDLGIAPQDFRTMTASTRVTMWLADRAVRNSGILDSDTPRERIAVLCSQNSGEAAATLEDVIIRGMSHDICSAVGRVIPMTAETEKAVEEEVKTGRLEVDDTTLLGRLNCAAGGFICNKYGFMGPSFSVSAACATALVALYSAVQMIRNGIIDAAVIGGAEEPLTPLHFLEFSALGALAGLSGSERTPGETSRPFDADRDGMVLGEGGGIIVIERESVARKRGAKVHAYITSMGASNNHLGMVESSRVTQEIAIDASFRDLSYGPDEVDMIECHATSTQQGDVEEILALQKFYNGSGRTVVTSLKSQIGHTLGASGVNSLIRGIMAMNAGVLPATLNYKNPDPEMKLEGTGISVLSEPAEWKLRNGGPRRFEVNAFGFGGSNYVVQAEQAEEALDTVLVSPKDHHDVSTALDGQAPMPDGTYLFRTQISGRPYRLGVVADSEEEAIAAVRKAEPITESGPIGSKRLRTLARSGIHLGTQELPAPPLAFVFPGQGSHYAGMGHELYDTFPIIREWMDKAAAVADFDLLHLVFHDKEEDLQKTRWQQPALFTLEYAMVQYLWALGIRPTALAGHSLGELTALCLAGVYSFEDGFRIVNKRAICMDKACSMHVDPGGMMAVDAPLDFLEDRIRDLEAVYVTNINSPHQVVLGGNMDALDALGAELKDRGFRRTMLRVSMAFHSPIMECIHDELEAFIADIEFNAPQIPVISNTTMLPYPAEPDEIKKIVMAHLESPVHWMQNVRTLWNVHGVRLFVEVGPRDILSNLIGDSLDDSECIQTCLPSVEPAVYRTAISQLYARGHVNAADQISYVAFPRSGEADDTPPKSVGIAQGPGSSTAVSPGPNTLEKIVQSTINSFVMESFGRFLRPALLNAIRQGYDPSFSEENLDGVLAQMFTGLPAQTPVIPQIPGLAQQPVVSASAPPSPFVQSSAPPEAASVQAVDSQATDTAEEVIQIVMEATGYDRDEIEPHMDLREDLSIRSSRLPVIMDAMEDRFRIKIELEDFMDARTIRDIADRVEALVSTDGPAGSAAQEAIEDVGEQEASEPATAVTESSIKRVVFSEAGLEPGQAKPIEMDSLESIVIFSSSEAKDIRKQVANVFRRDYGITAIPMTFVKDPGSENEDGFDLRDPHVSEHVESRNEDIKTQSGLVFVLDESLDEKLQDMEAVSRFLAGAFSLLKVFVESPSKKVVLLIHRSESPNPLSGLVREGMLGMFLSAAQEFSSVQFRTVGLDSETDLRVSIRAALDRSCTIVENIWHKGEAYTSEGRVVPAAFGGVSSLQLDSGDVVLFSGGGYGITSRLALSLVPYGCKIVLLGRTALDPEIDYLELLSQGEPSRERLAHVVSSRFPGINDADLDIKISGLSKALNVSKGIEGLRSSGADVSYFSCDVTDSVKVRSVVNEVIREHGRISGIVHGAGLLRDNFIKQMTSEDFSNVVDVKFLGAWNLFEASKDAGLKFFACLSSAAAIQGNPGQVNYAAGNRIMSALASFLRAGDSSIVFKAMFLPPIEGVGMADDPEIRALMKRMNAAYLQVDELAGLFCRELFVAPPEDVWVLFMRSLPDLTTMRLNQSDPEVRSDQMPAVTTTFPKKDFPLIDSITAVDLRTGQLVASRHFSDDKDLWIPDHKPFKFLKYPLVSAIMAVESFMEASKILLPHLSVKGVRDARFLDIIECPHGIERISEVTCQRVVGEETEVACTVELQTREISPSGRVLERKSSNYEATVIMGSSGDGLDEDLDGFPVRREELKTRPMDHAEVLDWYQERTDMTGRYRVMKELFGTAEGAVVGRFFYHQGDDFSDPLKTLYQYPPYLLEALMQLVNFYLIMRDRTEERSMIPYRIGEMRFSRKCREEEEVVLEARMENHGDETISWNARGVDLDGRTIMLVRDLTMRWFSS